MATKFTGWKAEDGSFHETQEAALEHERVTRFRRWCDENICRGGEWSSCMVANAILEAWNVEVKHPECAPHAAQVPVQPALNPLT